jgi:putative oxidoreductase
MRKPHPQNADETFFAGDAREAIMQDIHNGFQWLLQTDSGVVGLTLRIILTVVIFPHGA